MSRICWFVALFVGSLFAQEIQDIGSGDWYEVLNSRIDNSDFFYDSPVWEDGTPFNTLSSTLNNLFAAYSSIYVKHMEFTMNGIGYNFTLAGITYGRYTLKELVTIEGGFAVDDSDDPWRGDQGQKFGLISGDDAAGNVDEFYCGPMAFNYQHYDLANKRIMLGGDARIGVTESTDATCSLMDIGEGIGLATGMHRYGFEDLGSGKLGYVTSAVTVSARKRQFAVAKVRVYGETSQRFTPAIHFSPIKHSHFSTFSNEYDLLSSIDHPIESKHGIQTIVMYIRLVRTWQNSYSVFRYGNTLSDTSPLIQMNQDAPTSTSSSTNTGRVLRFFMDTVSENPINIVMPQQLEIGYWHQVAFVIDDNHMSIFFDGLPYFVMHFYSRKLDYALDQYFAWGADGRFATVDISDTRYFSDQKITSAEMTALYEEFMLRRTVCGDGLRQTGEACDDANRISLDGCSATCAIEGGYVCYGRNTTRASPDVCSAGTIDLSIDFDTGASATMDYSTAFTYTFNSDDGMTGVTVTNPRQVLPNYWQTLPLCKLSSLFGTGEFNYNAGAAQPTTVTFSFPALPAHNYIMIDFYGAFLDTFNSNRFMIKMDGVTTYWDRVNNNDRGFCSGSMYAVEDFPRDSKLPDCNNVVSYDEFVHFTHVARHTASLLTLTFTSDLADSTGSFAISNFTLTAGNMNPFPIETMGAKPLYSIGSSYSKDLDGTTNGLRIVHDSRPASLAMGSHRSRFQVQFPNAVNVNTVLEYWFRIAKSPMRNRGAYVTLIASSVQGTYTSPYVLDDCWNDPLNSDGCLTAYKFVRVCYYSSDERHNNIYSASIAASPYFCDVFIDPVLGSWHLESIEVMEKFAYKYGNTYGYESVNPIYMMADFSVRAAQFGDDRIAIVDFDEIKVLQPSAVLPAACPDIIAVGGSTGAYVKVGATTYQVTSSVITVRINPATHAVLEVAHHSNAAAFVTYVASGVLAFNDILAVATEGNINCFGCEATLKLLGGAGFPYASNTASFSLIGRYGAKTRSMPYQAQYYSDGNTFVQDMSDCHSRDIVISEASVGFTNIGSVVDTGAFYYELSSELHGYEGCFRYNTATEPMYSCLSSWQDMSPQRCSVCCESTGSVYFGVHWTYQCMCQNIIGTATCNTATPTPACGLPEIDDGQCNSRCVGDLRQYCGGTSGTYYNGYTVAGARRLAYSDVTINNCAGTTFSGSLPEIYDESYINGPIWTGVPGCLTIDLLGNRMVHSFRLRWALATGNHPQSWSVDYQIGNSATWVPHVSTTTGWESNPYSTVFDRVLNFPPLISDIRLNWNDGGTSSTVIIRDMQVNIWDTSLIKDSYTALTQVGTFNWTQMNIDYFPNAHAGANHFRGNDLFGFDYKTGRLMTTFLLPNFEANDYYILTQYTVDDDFNTGWFNMDTTTNFKQLYHGIGSYPRSATVHVRPRNGAALNYGYVFNGVGAVIQGTDVNEPYGGLLYAFNQSTVRLWAPSSVTYGNIVNVQQGWGQTNLEGQQLGEVFVRLNRGTTPDYDSGWDSMDAQGNAENDYTHSLGDLYAAVVEVWYRAPSGVNNGFVFKASGSAQSDDDGGAYGGVTYMYTTTTVRVMLPERNVQECSNGNMYYEISGSVTCQPCVGFTCPYRGTGIFVPSSYGGGKFAQAYDDVEVRVQIWTAANNFEAAFASNWQAISANNIAYITGTHNLGYIPDRFKGVVWLDTGTYIDWYFDSVGASQGTDYRVRQYGGTICATSTTAFRAWAPAKSSGAWTHAAGTVAFMGDGWGDGSNEVGVLNGQFRFLAWKRDGLTMRDSFLARITITDVDEAPGVQTFDATVIEQSSLGKYVAKVSTWDPDTGLGATDFTILDGNYDGAFDIDSTGSVTVANPTVLDFAFYPNFSLTIEATDGVRKEYGILEIILVDKNDPPVPEPFYLREVNENAKENELIGLPLNATDPDPTQSAIWFIVGGNYGNAFTLNSCSGQLRLLNPEAIDYENVTGLSFFTLDIVVTDDGPNAGNATTVVYINVTNGNDAPEWISSATLFVPENSAAGFVVPGDLDSLCIDTDGGDSHIYTIQYISAPSLGNGDEFAISGLNNIVVGNASFDFESGELDYLIGLRCQDFNTKKIQVPQNLSDDGVITVRVTDDNDAPIFTESNPIRTISENPSIGTAVTGGVLLAIDEDVNDIVDYVLVDSLGGAFTVVSVAGAEIRAASSALDFETAQSVTVVLQAFDAGILTTGTVASMAVNISVTIIIVDDNEAPTFIDSSININENTAAGTDIAVISATDPDTYAVQDMFFVLQSTTPALYEPSFQVIDPGLAFTATVKLLANVLNYEDASTIDLDFTVSDGEFTDAGTLTVNLIDRNDPPMFVCDDGVIVCDTIYVNENSADGILVVRLNVSDDDLDPLNYAMHSDSETYVENRFFIDSATGDLYVNFAGGNILNYEAKTTVSLLVVEVNDVTVKGPGSYTIQDSYYVQVVDLPEAPQWDSYELNEVNLLVVQEDANVGQTVGVPFNTIFYDDDIGDTLSYTRDATASIWVDFDAAPLVFSTGANKFNIHATTGQLTTNAFFAGEAGYRYQFNITVTDGMFPVSHRIIVDVSSTNQPPVLEGPMICNISEVVPITTHVCFMNASDPDGDDVVFKLSLGPGEVVPFLIGTVGFSYGYLEVSSVLNFESDPLYQFSVTVQDKKPNNRFTLFDTKTMSVYISDVNDPPIASPTIYSYDVDENSLTTLSLGYVHWTDEDADTLIYTISSGPTPFRVEYVNNSYCQIFVDGSLDYETDNAYTFTVRANDGSDFGFATVNVVINDKNEAPFVGDLNMQIQEGSIVNTYTTVLPSMLAYFDVVDPEDTDVEISITLQSPIVGMFSLVEDIGGNLNRYGLKLEKPSELDFEQFFEATVVVSMEEAVGSVPALETRFTNIVSTFTITVLNVNDIVIQSIYGGALGTSNQFLTTGGEAVTITGENLGRSYVNETYTVAYGPTGVEYTASACESTGSNQIECLTSGGCGDRHIWTVNILTIGDIGYSDPSVISTSYYRPDISSISVASVVRTEGGDVLDLYGTNFVGSSETAYQFAGYVDLIGVGGSTYQIYSAIGEDFTCRAGFSMFTLQDGDQVIVRCADQSCEMTFTVTISTAGFSASEMWCNVADVTLENWDSILRETNAQSDYGEVYEFSLEPSTFFPQAYAIGVTSDSVPSDYPVRSFGIYINPAPRFAITDWKETGGVLSEYTTSLKGSCNSGFDEGHAECVMPVGVGTGYSIRVLAGGLMSNFARDSSAVLLNMEYSDPVLLDVFVCDFVGTTATTCSSVGLDSLSTSGGLPFMILGALLTGSTGSGNEYEGYGNGELRYGPSTGYSAFCNVLTSWPVSIPTSTMISGVPVQTNGLHCTSLAGVGKDLTFWIAVGDQVSATSTFTVSYVPPTVTLVKMPVTATTAGNDIITVTGTNFGPAGLDESFRSIDVQYGHQEQFDAGIPTMLFHTLLSTCQVVSQTSMICRSGEGTGKNHLWQVEVQSQLSNILQTTTRYNSPIIGNFGVNISLPEYPISIRDYDTAGLQKAIVYGTNFGPIATVNYFVAPISVTAAWFNSITDAYVDFAYSNCIVTVDHSEMTCVTSQGVGADLKWTLIVDNITSSSPITGYGPPIINSFLLDGLTTSLLETGGGQNLTIFGENFGGDASLLSFVGYGPTGVEFILHESASPNFQCSSISHTRLECTTVSGVGANHSLLIIVGGQSSTEDILAGGAPKLSYNPPNIYSVSPLQGATAGEYLITVTGDSFGPSDLLAVYFWDRLVLGGDIIYVKDGDIRVRVPEGLNTGHSFQIVHSFIGCEAGCIQYSNIFSFDYLKPDINGLVVRDLLDDPNWTYLGIYTNASSGALNIVGGMFGHGIEEPTVPISINGTIYQAYTSQIFTRLSDAGADVVGNGLVWVAVYDAMNKTLAELQALTPTPCYRPIGYVMQSNLDVEHDHDYIGCIVNQPNGTFIVHAGDLSSEMMMFTDDSPDIRALNTTLLQAISDQLGGLPTTGGFPITFYGKSFGAQPSDVLVKLRLQDPDTMELYMPDVLCPVVSLDYGAPLSIVGDPQEVDEWQTLVCTAPAGVGLNVTIRVFKKLGSQQSVYTDGNNGFPCFPCFSYRPPSIAQAIYDNGARRRLSVVATSYPISITTNPNSVVLVGDAFGPSNLFSNTSVQVVIYDTYGEQDVTITSVDQNVSTVMIPARIDPKLIKIRVANQWFIDPSIIVNTNPMTASLVAPNTNLNTLGGQTISIFGENFGAAVDISNSSNVLLDDITTTSFGSVTFDVDGYMEPVTIVSWDHTQIDVLSPEHVGLNHDIKLEIAGVTHTFVGVNGFSYAPPVITSIFPESAPTTASSGGNPIVLTITGSNFGKSGEMNRYVQFGDVATIWPNQAKWNAGDHDEITIDLTPSQGNVSVSVWVDGQMSNSMIFTFLPPIATGISNNASTPVYEQATGPTGACSVYEDAQSYLASASDNPDLVRSCQADDFKVKLKIAGSNLGSHSLSLIVGDFECSTDEFGVLRNATIYASTMWDCTDTLTYSHQDSLIEVVAPIGIGVDIPIKIFVSGLEDQGGIDFRYSFLDPVVFGVDPGSGALSADDWYDGQGEAIVIYGENFGPIMSNVVVKIGNKYCEDPMWNDADSNGRGLPYISCTTRFDVLGAKDAIITVANRTIFVDAIAEDFDNSDAPYNLFNSVCKAGDAVIYYGIPFYDEVCIECPQGATCSTQERFNIRIDPRSLTGFWRVYHNVESNEADRRCPNERTNSSLTNRTECPDFLGCVPLDSCKANNNCLKGYEYMKNECEDKYIGKDRTCGNTAECTKGEACTARTPEGCQECMKENIYDDFGNCTCIGYERCAYCTVFEYYRINGECQPCPQNVWVIIGLFIFALIMFTIGGYVLNKKKFNLAFISIGFDYFQVLAVFASSDVPWPGILVQLFLLLQFFSFNIDITAPECVMPDFTYEMKWAISMLLPFLALVLFGFLHLYYVAFRFFVNGERGFKRLNSHHVTLVAMFIVMLYYLYLPLTRKVLEIFNCNPAVPDDGYTYTEWTSINCEGGLCRCWAEGEPQMFLFPYGLLFFCIYTVGFPLFAAFMIVTNINRIKEDQLLRAMDLGDTKSQNPAAFELRQKFHKLYYHFKPGKVYWILVILARKFWIAVAALLFRNNPSFQLSFVLLVVFTAFVLQVKHRPFMSSIEKEKEIEKHKIKVEEERKERKEKERVPGDSRYVHLRIAEHLEKIERQNELEKKRRKNQTNINEVEKRWADARIYFWDYNTVEAFLLGCSIFICASGIMFESRTFDERKDITDNLEALVVIVFLVIIVSIVYYFVVFFSEMFTACGLENNKYIRKYFMNVEEEAAEEEAVVFVDVSTIAAQTGGEMQKLIDPDKEFEKQRSRAELQEQNAKLLKQVADLKKLNQQLQLREKQFATGSTKKKKKLFDGEEAGTSVAAGSVMDSTGDNQL